MRLFRRKRTPPSESRFTAFGYNTDDIREKHQELMEGWGTTPSATDFVLPLCDRVDDLEVELAQWKEEPDGP